MFADCSPISAAIRRIRGEAVGAAVEGNRNGFSARKFHHRCDGRPNTLTLILDTDCNILAVFTPVNWKSSWKERVMTVCRVVSSS
jgi:hypothetical protein